VNAIENDDAFDASHPDADGMRAEVWAGLASRPKRLPSKYFYDARGSALFEAICEQPEYYLTRAELALMRTHIDAIAEALGPEVLLLEYGSGSGLKTRMLLEHLDRPVAYVPVEISPTALDASVERLGALFPEVEMLPVCADFTQPLTLPRPQHRQRRSVIYFPGSTIGNFDSREAIALLRNMRAEMGEQGRALVGVDRVKDAAVIEAAYNDAAGVTAQFTLNMLAHINRELDADFDLDAFAHRADYHSDTARVETRIVSRRDQDVQVAGRSFHFAAGEAMQVEYSCKYTQSAFADLASKAGLRVAQTWYDPARQFSLQLLKRA